MNEITDEVTDGGTDGEEGEERDSFEAFEAATGAGKVIDCYPVFREMREEAPVLVGKQWHRFGMEAMEDLLVGDSTPYTVLTYDAVQKVLRNYDDFSNSVYAKTAGLVMGRTLTEMDEPEHHLHRALVQQAFTTRAMQRWDVEIVQPVLTRLFDEFADRGHAELVSEAFFPFPVHVIAHMLGLPEADLPIFQRKAVELISIVTDPALAMAASQWLYDYFAGIIADRRQDRRDDVISMLAFAELDGQHLSDDEIIGFLRQLLPAGAETTYRGVSNMVFGLLTNPDQLDAVRADRSLVPRAVEEALRWEPPLTEIGRTCVRTVEIEGVTIEEDGYVFAGLGSANHDPERWEDPERFDIFREPKNHITFGLGPHICLGMHLARLEMRMALETVLDRLPNVRLDPEATDINVSGFGFRAAHSLPVLFDPEPR
jgi:cytochrome P450